MNMKNIKAYFIAGVLFTAVLGTFLHFAYELSGNNFFVGLFAPINESIWEHTKLIYFPTLICGLYINKNLKNQYPCIYSAMSFASLLGILLIIILFYTYSGIIGSHIAFVDISIFYISVIISFCVGYKLTLSCRQNSFGTLLQLLNILIVCLFVIFTLSPPDIPLFISRAA